MKYITYSFYRLLVVLLLFVWVVIYYLLLIPACLISLLMVCCWWVLSGKECRCAFKGHKDDPVILYWWIKVGQKMGDWFEFCL